MSYVIHAQNLQKSYGNFVAVEDISLKVHRGEIFGVVGPNGAGKTTTLETIIGLRQPDGGQVKVLGLDPYRQTTALQRRIGVQLQEAALPENMKVWEALDLFASFYTQTQDIDTLIDQWGLTDKRNTAFGGLSGGQKQRLFIALALVNNPELVFLDELTTGLDPQARLNTWEQVAAIRDQGTTVILVTHFMDEVERLCDRVAIIDHGRIVALDTPKRLIQGLHAQNQVSFRVHNGFDPGWMNHLPGVTQARRQGDMVTVNGSGSLLSTIAVALAEQGIDPLDLQQAQANLEDVFLAHTGRSYRS